MTKVEETWIANLRAEMDRQYQMGYADGQFHQQEIWKEAYRKSRIDGYEESLKDLAKVYKEGANETS